MSKLSITSTSLPGLHTIEREPIRDDRGFFERIFCSESYSNLLSNRDIRQINRTLTEKKGVVRGLHFQHPPYAECKIVTCLKGEIWDVALDVRRGSPTFLEHYSIILSAKNKKSLFIPEGFAHAFQTLTVNCEILYLHSADHCKEAEGAINALDPMLAIDWPLPISERSSKDADSQFLSGDFLGVALT